MASAPRDENSRLDAITHARMLTELCFLTQEEAAETVDLPRATFRRVLNGEVSPKIDVSGLTATVIKELYQTASGVAVRCQMAEHTLRMADLDQCVRWASLLAPEGPGTSAPLFVIACPFPGPDGRPGRFFPHCGITTAAQTRGRPGDPTLIGPWPISIKRKVCKCGIWS